MKHTTHTHTHTHTHLHVSKSSPTFRFPHQNSVCIFPLHHTPQPLLRPQFYHRTIFGEQCRSLSSSLSSFLHSPATSSLLGPNIPLCTLFSNTPILGSSLNVRDLVSHSYKNRHHYSSVQTITSFSPITHFDISQLTKYVRPFHLPLPLVRIST